MIARVAACVVALILLCTVGAQASTSPTPLEDYIGPTVSAGSDPGDRDWYVQVGPAPGSESALANGPRGSLQLIRIRVYNRSDDPIRLRATIRRLTFDNGQPMVGAVDQTSQQTEWMQLFRSRVTVPARSGRLVDVFVQIPRSAAVGDSAAAISIRKSRTRERAVVPVTLRVDGPRNAKLSSRDARIEYSAGRWPWSCGKLTWKYRAQNTGNTALVGRGRLVLRTLFGKQVNVSDLGEVAMAPNDTLAGSVTDCVSVPVFARPFVVVEQPMPGETNSDQTADDLQTPAELRLPRTAAVTSEPATADADQSSAGQSRAVETWPIAAQQPTLTALPTRWLTGIAACVVILTGGWLFARSRAIRRAGGVESTSRGKT